MKKIMDTTNDIAKLQEAAKQAKDDETVRRDWAKRLPLLAKSKDEALAAAATKDLSSEKVGGFTGVFVGLFATGNGQKSAAPADFDWFDYCED